MKWGSRKFVQAVAAQLALTAALAICLAEEGLRLYIPYVVGALVAVNVGYGAANAWLGRAGGREDEVR